MVATPSAFRMIGSWSLLASMVRGLQKIKVRWQWCGILIESIVRRGYHLMLFFSNQHSELSLEILECCTCYLFRYATWKGSFWDKQNKVHHAASSFPGSLFALGVTRSRCPEVAESTWRSDTNEVQKVGGGWGEPQGIRREVLSTSIYIWDIEFLCATFLCVVKMVWRVLCILHILFLLKFLWSSVVELRVSIWDDQHVGFGRKFGVDKYDLLVYLDLQTHTLFNETVKNFQMYVFLLISLRIFQK